MKSHRSRRYGSLCLQEPDYICLLLLGDCAPCLPMLHNPWQGSATPGCNLHHSKAQPLETGLEKYPLQGVDPRSHLICTPPRRATPPGSPQFLYWGIWASPPETDQDSCPGWLPLVPLDLVSPQEGFPPGPLTPRFKCFPATRIFAHYFLCVFCVVPGIEPLCETTANWNSLLIITYCKELNFPQTA